MQHNLNQGNESLLSGLMRVYRNEPIIFGASNYEHNVWNSTQGNLMSVDGNEFPVTIGRKIISLTMESLFDFKLDLSYALTSHRTQGTAFENVITPVVDNCMLDRLWLYTAITRAKRQCVLVGSKEVLRSKAHDK